MDAVIKKKGESRIEFRVSNEEKELFEYAKYLSGYKSFSAFARNILAKEAKAIVEEKSKILASEKDKEIFFNALMGKEEAPNSALLSAIKYHYDLVNQ